MAKLVTYIDPPSGWRYGFPKELPDLRPDDIEAWLVEQGYPKWLLDDGMGKYIRCWQELVQDDS